MDRAAMGKGIADLFEGLMKGLDQENEPKVKATLEQEGNTIVMEHEHIIVIGLDNDDTGTHIGIRMGGRASKNSLRQTVFALVKAINEGTCKEE